MRSLLFFALLVSATAQARCLYWEEERTDYPCFDFRDYVYAHARCEIHDAPTNRWGGKPTESTLLFCERRFRRNPERCSNNDTSNVRLCFEMLKRQHPELREE